MPLYNYQCSKCHYTIDHYLSINDRNRKFECPICGNKLIKLIGTGTIFNLKGKNWYKSGIQ
jgi:putative FmdB family regulatory protein